MNPWHGLSCSKLKRTVVTSRHDHACNLLCQFSRSNDCLAHVVKKDLAHLLPDGEILMTRRSILFDLSGVNPHTADYIDLAPGEAMSERERYKEGKYRAHCVALGCCFTPFIIDSYGCLAPAALRLLKEIQAESVTSLGPPALFHLTRSCFLARLSSQWQLDNAKIIVQWLTMMRAAHLRTIRQTADTALSFSTIQMTDLDSALITADPGPGSDAAPA